MNTLVVGIGCFCLGLLVGALARDIATEVSRTLPPARKVAMHLTRPNGRLMLTAALVAAVLLQFLVGALLITTRQSQTDQSRAQVAYSRCTTQWQQDFATAYRARLAASTAADKARDAADGAQDAVFRSVAARNATEFKRSLAAYVKLRDAQVRARRIQAETRLAHPLPPLPTELCGRPTR